MAFGADIDASFAGDWALFAEDGALVESFAGEGKIIESFAEVGKMEV